MESGLKICTASLGPLEAWAAGGGVCLDSRLCSWARLTENLPTRASGLVVTWKRPMVVVGLGEGHGEVRGEGWWDPPTARWGSPSTTSPPCPPPPLRGDEESLCSVFSGLERLEEDEEEEDEEEEEVVEEDSVQAGRWTGRDSVANET